MSFDRLGNLLNGKPFVLYFTPEVQESCFCAGRVLGGAVLSFHQCLCMRKVAGSSHVAALGLTAATIGP